MNICPHINIHSHINISSHMNICTRSDGLWDVMSIEEAVATVRGLIAQGSRLTMTDIAGEMLDLSLRKGKWQLIL